MNPEEHDDLWQLLGKARAPQPSPFFSRNVLRAVREQEHDRPAGLAGFFRKWRVPAVSAGLVFAAAALMLNRVDQPDSVTLLAQQVSASPDYQVITHLDELLDSEQNSVWLESSSE
jgi:hypothetical protein